MPHPVLSALVARRQKSVWAINERLAGKTRNHSAPIDTVAKPHQPLFTRQHTLRAYHLILATEIAEFTRQEDVIALLQGDPFLDPFALCFFCSVMVPACKNPTSCNNNEAVFQVPE
jgi:hypothetical protein